MHQGFIVFTLHLSHSPPASFFPDSIYGRFLVLFDNQCSRPGTRHTMGQHKAQECGTAKTTL